MGSKATFKRLTNAAFRDWGTTRAPQIRAVALWRERGMTIVSPIWYNVSLHS